MASGVNCTVSYPNSGGPTSERACTGDPTESNGATDLDPWTQIAHEVRKMAALMKKSCGIFNSGISNKGWGETSERNELGVISTV